VVSEGITIRQATTADVPDLVRLRRMMFEAMGFDCTRNWGSQTATRCN
jgi:hypothetical protein